MDLNRMKTASMTKIHLAAVVKYTAKVGSD